MRIFVFRQRTLDVEDGIAEFALELIFVGLTLRQILGEKVVLTRRPEVARPAVITFVQVDQMLCFYDRRVKAATSSLERRR